MDLAEQRAGIYIHLPFCVVRCTYCDFYSLTGRDEIAPAYVGALVREIGEFSPREGYAPVIDTIYLGGGTPSYLPAGSVARLLQAVRGSFAVASDAEITMEANPESATAEKLAEARAAGVNRLSIGVQSFRAELLALMGRPHGVQGGAQAVAAARSCGFDNVNIDLIYGLPGQEATAWGEDLDRAAALGTEHLSAYLLETDKETPLARLVESGTLAEPDAKTIESLYRLTEDRLARSGLERYEISNWARGGKVSRHNIGYWSDRPYVGFGASAHSYYRGRRRACRLSASGYISSVAGGDATRSPLDEGDRETRIAEAIIGAMRLVCGADFDAIGARYEVDLWSRYAADLADLVRRGWVVVARPHVRLTIEGILWSMDALAVFVSPGRSVPSPTPAVRSAARI